MNYDEIIIWLSLVFKHMLYTFLFVGYSRRTSNYPERIAISNPTHMISIGDPIAIGVETLRIDSGCSLKKELIELIPLNP